MTIFARTVVCFIFSLYFTDGGVIDKGEDSANLTIVGYYEALEKSRVQLEWHEGIEFEDFDLEIDFEEAFKRGGVELNVTDNGSDDFAWDAIDENRIIGGAQTVPNEFPWMVYLVTRYASVNLASVCGGTILSARWVLTAAHCVLFENNPNVLASSAEVWPGCSTLNACLPRIFASRYFEPGFQFNYVAGNDIALLELSSSLSFSNRVYVAFMPRLRPVKNGGIFDIGGWGRISDTSNQGSFNLKKALVRSRTCLNGISSNIICTNWQTGTTCQGDSGGMMGQIQNGRFIQFGITSFGIQNPDFPGFCSREILAGFTETFPWLRWIGQVTNFQYYCA